jgi:hypothetical protein
MCETDNLGFKKMYNNKFKELGMVAVAQKVKKKFDMQ